MHVRFVSYATRVAIIGSSVPHAVRRYVEALEEPSKLLDLLSAPGSDDLEPTRTAAARQALYPDVSIDCFRNCCIEFLAQYLPMSALLAGVKSGQLYQGHFNANQYNYLEVAASFLL